ncbi:hypothetical protein FB567DRAFT_441413 [Paraphoma chrysanthemicola]|uniref:Uncharacterized protein n=1 Tax=Paraphoma chrysanthemicola TaxID=798071 RepID=A0A8K0R6R3_9PLEO|nr:hypothetical protein FB567DRAFT_441413 [Paraphoma chrysanthemicola]
MSPEKEGEQGSRRQTSLETALHHSQGRQRKGSLRQAAMAKMRERSSSSRKRGTPEASIISAAAGHSPLLDDDSGAWFPEEQPQAQPLPASAIHSDTQQTHQKPFLLASPSISSPEGPYVSTTDEEETMSLDDQSISSTSTFMLDPQHATQAFPRRRAHRVGQTASIAVHAATAVIDNNEEDGEEWDYSETEWWGWVILVTTWTVFVVVMGSCLGVWSWAWDVGETPYAPPDLEDDDTLPITGYYPALMVCTAVMSWVWVVVAWVGIKYFRHAKVGADDS